MAPSVTSGYLVLQAGGVAPHSHVVVVAPSVQDTTLVELVSQEALAPSAVHVSVRPSPTEQLAVQPVARAIGPWMGDIGRGFTLTGALTGGCVGACAAGAEGSATANTAAKAS